MSALYRELGVCPARVTLEAIKYKYTVRIRLLDLRYPLAIRVNSILIYIIDLKLTFSALI